MIPNTASHSHIATNADAAALLRDHAAQCRALRQTWEFLGREDGERCRFDLSTVGDKMVSVKDDVGVLRIQIFDLAQVFKQLKAQPILALVADGQIREDEIASRGWTIQIGHAGNGRACEHWETGRRGWSAARGDGAGIFQTGMEEEICVVGKGNVLFVLKDAKLNNRGRVHGATVGTGFGAATTGSRTHWLLDDL